MRGRIQKWGNSVAIRLPGAVLEAAHFAMDQAIEIKAEKGVLVIRSVDALPTYTLDDLLTGVTPENLNIDPQWQAA